MRSLILYCPRPACGSPDVMAFGEEEEGMFMGCMTCSHDWVETKWDYKCTQIALLAPLWLEHSIGDKYIMDGEKGWQIAYYPLLTDGKTGEYYDEPRVLVERPRLFEGVPGTDFREVPLRYLEKCDS